MSNGQDTLRFDAQGFTKPMPHPTNSEFLVVYHEDDDLSHWVKLDPKTQNWTIVEGEREGTKQGGGRREAVPKRAIDEEMKAGETVGGFVQSMIHGGTMGWADDLIGLMSPEMAAKWEANRKQFRQQHQIASGIGELAGGIGSFMAGGAALRGGAALAKGGVALARGGAAGRAGASTVGRAVARQAARGPARAAARTSAAAPVSRVAPTAASTVAPTAAQAPRSLLRQSIRTGLEGAGFGAAYGAGEAEGGVGDRARAALPGAVFGGVMGGAMPGAMGVLSSGAGKLAGMAGGRMERFRRGMGEGRLLGGDSPASARAMAREEAAGGGGLLGGGALGAITRMPRRVTDALRGKGGVTLAPERRSARAMLDDIDAAKPEDWRDLVRGWQRETPDAFIDASGRTLTEDQIWIRKLADYMEETGTARPGQLLATIEAQTAANVGGAASGVGGYSQVAEGLLPAVRQSARELASEVSDAVEGWTARQMRRLGGEAAEGATTTGRRLSSRQQARSDEAAVLYGRLEELSLSPSAKREISESFGREGAFRNPTTKRELEETWIDLIETQNRDLPLGQQIGLDADGLVIPLEKALAQGAIDSAGRAELLVRVVRQTAKKYAPSEISGTANDVKYKNLMGMADGLYETLNRVTSGDTKAALAAYRRQSEGLRGFLRGEELVRKPAQVTIKSLEDTIEEVRRNAVHNISDDIDDVVRREMQDEVEDALAEGYVTALADKARQAHISGSSASPEQVFLDAEPLLRKLFGSETDDLLKMLERRLEERQRLLQIQGIKPSAAAIDPGTEAAGVAKEATFFGAGQTQAWLRERAEAARRWAGGPKPQQLAIARLGQLPMREGLERLGTMRRYDQLRQLGQQRLGEDLAVSGGLLSAGANRAREPRAPTYDEETQGLLQNYRPYLR
jgi:hypothetical protein